MCTSYPHPHRVLHEFSYGAPLPTIPSTFHYGCHNFLNPVTHFSASVTCLTNRTYSVSVSAFTRIGDGPISEAIKVLTQQGGISFIETFNSYYCWSRHAWSLRKNILQISLFLKRVLKQDIWKHRWNTEIFKNWFVFLFLDWCSHDLLITSVSLQLRKSW